MRLKDKKVVLEEDAVEIIIVDYYFNNEETTKITRLMKPTFFDLKKGKKISMSKEHLGQQIYINFHVNKRFGRKILV